MDSSNAPVTLKSNSIVDHYRPSWLDTLPIVMVGNWDGDPLFRNRRGGNPDWYKEDYDREFTEEAVMKLKEKGVTMVITDLFKGFGLDAEQDHIRQIRKLVSLCKKHGLKVGVYIGSTICYETFLLEEPDAQKWFVPDFMGKPVLWDSRQPFRKRVYFMHPDSPDMSCLKKERISVLTIHIHWELILKILNTGKIKLNTLNTFTRISVTTVT